MTIATTTKLSNNKDKSTIECAKHGVIGTAPHDVAARIRDAHNKANHPRSLKRSTK